MKHGEERWTMQRGWTFVTLNSKWILHNLPEFTRQFALLFCIIPVSLAFSGFCISFLVNFGVALIAQAISTLIILLILIPAVTICLICAIFAAWSFEFAKIAYFHFFELEENRKKVEIVEKLKIL